MYITLGVVSDDIVLDREYVYRVYKEYYSCSYKDCMALIMEGRRSRVWHIQQHSILYIISI